MNLIQRAVARRYSDEEGFTLIELLIVILILGILATIVVLGIGAFKDTGEHQACITSARTAESANAAYYAKNTAYTNVAGLVGAKLIKATPKWAFTFDSDGNIADSQCPA